MLTLAMESVRAWERLNDPEYCGQLNMGEVYDLAVKAGYPAEVAQRAASQRGWDRLVAGVEM